MKELKDSEKSHKQVSGFGAVVKVVDSHPADGVQFPARAAVFS